MKLIEIFKEKYLTKNDNTIIYLETKLIILLYI